MRVILSRDRPAQLDLLLRTMTAHMAPEPTAVVWHASSRPFELGYGRLRELSHPAVRWLDDREPPGFEGLVRAAVTIAARVAGGALTFLCDDGVFVRTVPRDHAWAAGFHGLLDDEVLCVSLRLGANTSYCHPTGAAQAVPEHAVYPWAAAQGDFGYPGSVDAHVFRAVDVAAMLDGRGCPNPTALELALVAGCAGLAGRRPLMRRLALSAYTGVPANRVSEQSGVRHMAGPSAAELNERFLAGGRLAAPSMLELELVTGAHSELPLRWLP